MAIGIMSVIGAASKLAGATGSDNSGVLGGLSEKMNASSVVPAAIGVGQTIAGLVKKKKADAMMPNAEDPEQRAMQRLISRQRRAYQTGTANNADRAALRQAMQSGLSNTFKYGAGSRGLNAMNQMYMQGLMGLNQANRNMAAQTINQEKQAIDDLAQRRLDIQMTKYDREQARAAQLLQEGKQNMGAALMKGLNLSVNPMSVTSNSSSNGG